MNENEINDMYDFYIEKIKNKMMILKMKNGTLAKKTGITRKQISYYMSKKQIPSVIKLMQILSAVNMKMCINHTELDDRRKIFPDAVLKTK